MPWTSSAPSRSPERCSATPHPGVIHSGERVLASSAAAGTFAMASVRSTSLSPTKRCLAELHRLVVAQAPRRSAFPRTVHIEAVGLDVVHLTQHEALTAVGLTVADIHRDDWTACQTVGDAVRHMGYQGLVAPSATGAGLVVVVFESKLRPGQLRVTAHQAVTS